MSEKPSYPPYATKDLSELNMNVPSWAVVGPSGQSWKSPGSINFLEAGQHVQKVEDFLGMYSKLSKPNDLPSKSRESCRVSTLFIGDDEEKFLQSQAFTALKKSVEDYGILFIDTEFADAASLKKMGCNQAAASGTIDLIQLGGLTGFAALLQVQFDCRDLHGCVCGRERECKAGGCPLNVTSHKAWECRDSFQNYGVTVPTIIVDWLEDQSIFKVQSQIVNTDGSYGDIERLEMLLGIKIRTFIELQNLTITWFPQRETACNYKDCSRRGKDFGSELLLDQHIDQVHGGVHQKKSSNSFLSKMMGITPADEHYKKIMRQPIYKAERRKPYSRWNAALRYYDLCDVLVPAVFLLKIGMDVVSRERATCTTTNVVPYLRQVLMVYKNEPSLTVFRKEMPPGKYFPFKEWTDCDYRDIKNSEAGAFPWRAGLESTYNADGLIIIRNLRSLSSELTADAYQIVSSWDDIHECYRPPQEYIDRLGTAKQVWRLKPMCGAPVSLDVSERFAKKRLGLILHGAEQKKEREGLGKHHFAGLKRAGEIIQPEAKRVCVMENHLVTFPVYYGHCFKCGAADHTFENCKRKLKCLYPLCIDKSKKHDVRVCDTLHMICDACRNRGHSPRDHRHFDLLSLIKIAILWSPAGLYTSLPILDGDKSFWRQPSDEEFLYGVFNRSRKVLMHEKIKN